MACINDLKSIKLSTEKLRAIYRTFRSAALQAGESASDFDAWCINEAETRQFAEGISRCVLIVDAAASQAVIAMTTRTVRHPNDMIEWGGFMSSTIINDTSKGDEFLAAHGWPN
jgi:hypothetical protein